MENYSLGVKDWNTGPGGIAYTIARAYELENGQYLVIDSRSDWNSWNRADKVWFYDNKEQLPQYKTIEEVEDDFIYTKKKRRQRDNYLRYLKQLNDNNDIWLFLELKTVFDFVDEFTWQKISRKDLALKNIEDLISLVDNREFDKISRKITFIKNKFGIDCVDYTLLKALQ